MIWCGAIVPCRSISRLTVCSAMPPLSWWPMIGTPFTLAMSAASPVECSEMLPEVVRSLAGLQRGHGRVEPGLREVLERREHAAVDLDALDVVATGRVDLDARVAQDARLEQRLRHQEVLADRECRAAAVEGVLAVRAVDGRRLEQLPAVEDRLRVVLRGALAGRADLEVQVRGLGGVGLADAADHRAGDDLRALLERLELRVLRVETDLAGEVVVVRRELAAVAVQLGVEDLVESAGVA